MAATPEIDRRREYTESRFKALVGMSTLFGSLGEVGSRAFIYATGSMARGEATEGSDLDLFVIDHLDDGAERLSFVETALLTARLDQLRSDAGFRPFSRGGQFIRPHSLQSVVELLGDPLDDAQNAFTARILLLINSRPLWNTSAYDTAWNQVLNAYWQPQRPDAAFRPIMLINDIRRWWGVLCLNFERYNKQVVVDDVSARSGYERRIANIKLRYARLLACYSPILRLIHLSDPGGSVTRVDAERALRETPVARIEALRDDGALGTPIRAAAEEILTMYDSYLAFMNKTKGELKLAVVEDQQWHPVKAEAYRFHDQFMQLYTQLGAGKGLFAYSLA